MRRTIKEIQNAWKQIARDKFSHLFLISERDIAKEQFIKAFETLDKWYEFYTSILEMWKARDMDSAKRYLANYYWNKFIKK